MEESVISLYEDPTSYFSHLNNRLGAKYVQMIKRALYLTEGCAIVAAAVHNIKPLMYKKCKTCNGVGAVVCPYCKGRKNIPSTLANHRISKGVNSTDLAAAAGLESSTACPFCGEGCAWDREEEWIDRWNEWSYRVARLDFSRMPFLHNWTDAPDSSPNLVRGIGTPRIAPGVPETTDAAIAMSGSGATSAAGQGPQSKLGSGKKAVVANPYQGVRAELDKDAEVVQSSKMRFDHPYLYGKANFGLDLMYKQGMYPQNLCTKRRDARSKFWDWFRILPPHLNPTVNQSLYAPSTDSSASAATTTSLSGSGSAILPPAARMAQSVGGGSQTAFGLRHHHSSSSAGSHPHGASSSSSSPSSSMAPSSSTAPSSGGGDSSILLAEAAALRDEGRLEENISAVVLGEPKPFIFRNTAGTVVCPCCHGKPHSFGLDLSGIWSRLTLAEKPIWAKALAEMQRRNWAPEDEHVNVTLSHQHHNHNHSGHFHGGRGAHNVLRTTTTGIQSRHRRAAITDSPYYSAGLDPEYENGILCARRLNASSARTGSGFGSGSGSGVDPASRLRALHKATLQEVVSGRSSSTVEPYREELTKLVIAGPSARDALHFVPPPSSASHQSGVSSSSTATVGKAKKTKSPTKNRLGGKKEGEEEEGEKEEEKEAALAGLSRRFALELKLQRDSLLRTNAYRGMMKALGAGQPRFPTLEEVITAVNMVGQASMHGSPEASAAGGAAGK